MTGLITDDEARTITLGALYEAKKAGRHEGVPETELLELIKWAEGARLSAGLLENVLDGSMHVSLVDGQPAFCLSPKGNRDVEQLLLEAKQE